jgi:hypothetical protein
LTRICYRNVAGNFRIAPNDCNMNTKQLNKLTMYLAVEGICDATPTAWQSPQIFRPSLTPPMKI